MTTGKVAQGRLQMPRIRAILTASTKEDRMFFVCQQQPDSDTVEVLWQCATEETAQNEVDRFNSNLADAGIPSTYYAFVL